MAIAFNYVASCAKCQNEQAAFGSSQHWEHNRTKTPATDAVNRPPHYNVGGIEAIDVIEAWQLDFHRGNAVKYIARAGLKDPAKLREDIEKAIWYLQRLIDGAE